jgi:hypothetical protein
MSTVAFSVFVGWAWMKAVTTLPTFVRHVYASGFSRFDIRGSNLNKPLLTKKKTSAKR